MLEDQKQRPTLIDQLLDTFFHLPTLFAVALFMVTLLWRLYDIGLDVGGESVRLDSNQGHLILHWGKGCCDIDW